MNGKTKTWIIFILLNIAEVVGVYLIYKISYTLGIYVDSIVCQGEECPRYVGGLIGNAAIFAFGLIAFIVVDIFFLSLVKLAAFIIKINKELANHIRIKYFK